MSVCVFGVNGSNQFKNGYGKMWKEEPSEICWPCCSRTHTHQLCDNVRKAGKKVRCLTEFSGKKESNSQRRKQMSVNCALKESNREIYALEEVAVFRANHFEPVVPLLIRPQPYTRAIVYNVCWLLSCTNIKRHKTAKKPFHWNFRRTIQSTPHKLYQHIFTYRSGAIYRCVCFVLLMDAHTSLQSVRFAHFLDYHQLLFCMGLCFVFSFVCVCCVCVQARLFNLKFV